MFVDVDSVSRVSGGGGEHKHEVMDGSVIGHGIGGKVIPAKMVRLAKS